MNDDIEASIAVGHNGMVHIVSNPDRTIDIEKLIKALGNKENIVDVRSTPSKLTVTIVNHEIVDVESIKNLGARGIGEGKDTISMIFGNQSPYIEEDLKNVL